MKKHRRQIIRLGIGIAGFVLLGVMIWPAGRGAISERVNSMVTAGTASSQGNLEQLRRENRELKAEVSSLLSLKRENTRLRKALEIEDQANIETYISAQVLKNMDSNYLRRSVVLNKGSESEVSEGYAVIHNGFVIGEIVEVNARTSRMRLITDPESKIAVRVNNEAESKGVLKSPFGIELQIDLVPQAESVSVGTRVFTSGIDGLPARLPIGRIARVDSSQTQYHDIGLETPIDFQKLREVFILVPS